MTSTDFPHNPDIPLQITISDIRSTRGETESPVVILKVTIYNTSSDKGLSFLRWSTPLDKMAVPMGIFVFTSLSSGKPAPCVGLKLNRKIPDSGFFSKDDTIQITAGGKVEMDVEVKAPHVSLDTGERYSVQVVGHWMHVKFGAEAELSAAEEGVIRGGFSSEAVQFDA
ncbi:hypothetical protein B0O99DRAFT_690637 [Bisporella sp. PMI_857]|nr:hypothetical protein B0O99DRAFT_690637 [Bisporella sp. PMI_857]